MWGQNDLVEFGYIDNNTLQAWTDANLDVRPNPFPNEEWDHLAVVSEGPKILVYTNGVLAGSRSQSLPANNSFLFNIGGGGVFDGGGNFFKGQIDEVAVFSKPLSAAQICNEYASAVATVPIVVAQPEPVSTFEGAPILASVSVCGSSDLSFHWFRGVTEIAVTTEPRLVIPSAKISDSGTYVVRAVNDYGSADSDSFEVVVLAASVPVIDVQPVSVTRYVGLPVTLQVAVSGTPPFTYKWQLNGNDIAGATSATLSLDPAKSSDAGKYKVIITNPIGKTPSDEVVLTVLTPTPGSYEAALVASRPTAFWRLGESDGSIAYDYAGGFDGTYNNVTLGIAGSLQGNSDTAASFDGNSSSVTTTASLDRFAAFSLTGWIRRTGAQLDRTGLFGQNDLIEFGFIDNGTLEAYVSAVGNSIDVASTVVDEAWAFVVLTGDGSTVRLYVDGREVGNLPVNVKSYGTSAFKVNIGGGGLFDATKNFFLGDIDEVALHNRAISAPEVCALYLSGSAIPARAVIELGGATILDTKPTGTAHTGQNNGAHWMKSDGVRSGFMQFSAIPGGQIVLPADADFNTTTGTIAFWVRSAGTTGPGNDGAILFDRRTSAGDVIVQNDNGTIFVQASGGVNSFSTSGSISDDQWHHVAYVYDQAKGGNTTVYIDGQVSGTGAASGAWGWVAGQQIELGRSHDSYWKQFNGGLDDFRIYNRILTDVEVAQMMTDDSGDLVASDALKVRYSFDHLPQGVALTWPCGVLQQTDVLKDAGTVWTDIVGATPPYATGPVSGVRYYRVRN